MTLNEVIENLGELRDGGKSRPQPYANAQPASRPRRPRNQPWQQTRRLRHGPVQPIRRRYRSARRRKSGRTCRFRKIWQAVLAKIPAQKAFVRNSASAAHVLGIEGRNFKLGFAPGDKAAMDILGTQANRKFVETLLHEISGNDWTLKLSVNEELVSKSKAAEKIRLTISRTNR